MDQDKYEERKKDQVLQQFYDACEDMNWGEGSQMLSVEVVFRSKFECEIQIKKKLPKKKYA